MTDSDSNKLIATGLDRLAEVVCRHPNDHLLAVWVLDALDFAPHYSAELTAIHSGLPSAELEQSIRNILLELGCSVLPPPASLAERFLRSTAGRIARKEISAELGAKIIEQVYDDFGRPPRYDEMSLLAHELEDVDLLSFDREALLQEIRDLAARLANGPRD